LVRRWRVHASVLQAAGQYRDFGGFQVPMRPL